MPVKAMTSKPAQPFARYGFHVERHDAASEADNVGPHSSTSRPEASPEQYSDTGCAQPTIRTSSAATSDAASTSESNTDEGRAELQAAATHSTWATTPTTDARASDAFMCKHFDTYWRTGARLRRGFRHPDPAALGFAAKTKAIRVPRAGLEPADTSSSCVVLRRLASRNGGPRRRKTTKGDARFRLCR